jgi:hypothetical protein
MSSEDAMARDGMDAVAFPFGLPWHALFARLESHIIVIEDILKLACNTKLVSTIL